MESTTFEDVPAPIEANGHAQTDLQANGAGEENGAAVVPRGLYLVRIPKPPMDDSELKKLQAEFQGHLANLKAKNAELQAKRDVVRGYKRQMGEARGLKETSEPEYQDKRSRIMELKKVRSNYLDRIKAIKENLQGLDCKSEAELDEKIRELEHRIAHEGMPLREEKQTVQQIAKLNALRGRIRDYDTHKNELVELESEAAKIKAIIGDMDSEFSVIQSERDATKAVVKDISGNLKGAQDELAELEREQAALLELKEATLKNLDSQRDEANASMRDYRENRKFSLVVRDMVAAGQTDEAAALVRTQVDEWVAKLSSDKEYRNDYLNLWAAQRKFPVSELLPKSCTTVPDASSTRSAGGRGDGRGGRGGAKPPPPEPRGAEKAKSIIEQLLQEASKEAQQARALAPIHGGSDGDDEEDAAPLSAAAPVKKAEPYQPPGLTKEDKAPARLVASNAAAAAAAAAAFNFKVELPKVPEQPEFVPPVIHREEQSKEQLREEQLRKAAEAEDRKRKRAEQAERKKQQAAEAAKKLEQERKERDVATRAAAISSKKAAATAAEAAETQPAEEADRSLPADAIAAPTVQQQAVTKMSAPTAFEKRQMLAAAKRPKSRNTPIKQAQSIWTQYQGWIIFAVVMLLCVILGIMFLI